MKTKVPRHTSDSTRPIYNEVDVEQSGLYWPIL
jgi:hypothetical protein